MPTAQPKQENCVICGEPFQSCRNKITCSPECNEKRKKQIDARVRQGLGRKGSIDVCRACGKQYVVTGTTQKYCSERCKAKTKHSYKKKCAKTVPKNCIICGNAFLTNKRDNVMTCGKVCAQKYRSMRMKLQADIKNIDIPAQFWAHDMRCPWANNLWDTPPAPGVKWDSQEADPMTNRMTNDGVWVRQQKIDEEIIHEIEEAI